ncbi:MFS transporter [Aneurinibacillus thermoaerophilus]|uniref:MFS transporter n=1 Tax=Aneurinibacillus thermoaerophilus TaxID=143495 RepID=UPI002E2521B5|nr:MFS transporter [Aneurinibacillus thermoaerophilus]MED0763995.1 MFS transporter [Aneurinibacillus thermoaerophilus]
MENKRRRARIITMFATFLAFMGIGVVDPILPSIAEQIGATHWQVEMLFTSYIFTMAIMMLPAGLLAGKFGDKPMMVAGLVIVTIFALLCGFSNTIAELSSFRAGWGLGNSFFFATAMTLLIALSKEVSSAVGLYEAAIGLGMAGGPLVGGILGGYTWRYPFISTGLLIFIAFILVCFFVKVPGQRPKRKTAGFKEMGHLFSYSPFLRGALAGMFYNYGFFTVLAYSPLVMNLPTIQLGLIFFGWGLCLAYGSAVLSHKLEKKYDVKKLLRWGLLLFSLFLFALYFVKLTWLQIVLVILSGLFSGLNNALFTTHVMESSPYERSITSGVYNFVRWLGAGVAPILSGVLGHKLFPQAPFGISGFIVLVGFLLMLLPVREPRRREEERRIHLHKKMGIY